MLTRKGCKTTAQITRHQHVIHVIKLQGEKFFDRNYGGGTVINWSRTLSRDVSNFKTLFYGLNFRGDGAPYRIDENEELGHNGRGIYSDV